MWLLLAAALAADPVQTPVQVTVGGGPDLAFVRLGMGSRDGWLTTGGFGGVKVIGFPLGEATMLPLRRSWVEPLETVIAPDVGVYVGLGNEWIGARLGVGYALPAMVDAFAQVATLQMYRAMLGEREDAPSAWTPFVSVEVRVPAR